MLFFCLFGNTAVRLFLLACPYYTYVSVRLHVLAFLSRWCFEVPNYKAMKAVIRNCGSADTVLCSYTGCSALYTLLKNICVRRNIFLLFFVDNKACFI